MLGNFFIINTNKPNTILILTNLMLNDIIICHEMSPRSQQSWSSEVQEPLLLLQLARLRLPAVAGELELVQREELLQEALHGPRQLRDPAGVGLGQGLHGR